MILEIVWSPAGAGGWVACGTTVWQWWDALEYYEKVAEATDVNWFTVEED